MCQFSSIIFILCELINTQSKQQMDYSNPELQKIGTLIGKYRIQYLIAGGSFGKVYMASHTNKKYAIKEMPEPTELDLKEHMESEVKVLGDLSHENIVKLYEVIRERSHVYMVMEFCQSDLKNIYNERGGLFSEQEAYQIFLQIANGMNELVKLHIVHRDLKPANIVYTRGVFKLADFGLAKYIDHQCQLLKTQAGTPFYMAPQILLRERYTSKCDIWSLGIIYYQLLFGRFPWPLGKQSEYAHRIKYAPLVFPKSISLKSRRLLEGMLGYEEYRRFSWKELVNEINAPIIQSNFESDKSFHKSTMQKLLNLELNRISMASFGRKVEALKNEEKKSVVGLVNKLFNNQSRQVCGYFIKTKIKI